MAVRCVDMAVLPLAYNEVMANRQTFVSALVVCLCVFWTDAWRVAASSPATASRRVQQLLTATEADLESRIPQQFNAIQDFNATVDMVPALGTTEKSKITEYKDVRGYILFRKPTISASSGLSGGAQQSLSTWYPTATHSNSTCRPRAFSSPDGMTSPRSRRTKSRTGVRNISSKRCWCTRWSRTKSLSC